MIILGNQAMSNIDLKFMPDFVKQTDTHRLFELVSTEAVGSANAQNRPRMLGRSTVCLLCNQRLMIYSGQNISETERRRALFDSPFYLIWPWSILPRLAEVDHGHNSQLKPDDERLDICSCADAVSTVSSLSTLLL